MKNLPKTLLILLIIVLSASILVQCTPGALEDPYLFEGIMYPPTKRIDLVEDYFGEEVPDPYRWLEELDSDETSDWVNDQNTLSRPYLEQIPQRNRIKVLLTERWNYERYGIPFKEGGNYFYTRNDGLQNQSILYVAESLDSEPRVLIDPNTFSEDATISLRSYEVSPDGRFIAYSTSDGGSDWKTWHVREIEPVMTCLTFLITLSSSESPGR